MKADGMMRLDSLAMVNRLADARGELLHKIAVIEAKHETVLGFAPPPFCITVDGVRQDETILALVRPVLVGELKAQVAQLDRDLEALGVRCR